jgi:hypothetical protein
MKALSEVHKLRALELHIPCGTYQPPINLHTLPSDVSITTTLSDL